MNLGWFARNGVPQTINLALTDLEILLAGSFSCWFRLNRALLSLRLLRATGVLPEDLVGATHNRAGR